MRQPVSDYESHHVSRTRSTDGELRLAGAGCARVTESEAQRHECGRQDRDMRIQLPQEASKVLVYVYMHALPCIHVLHGQSAAPTPPTEKKQARPRCICIYVHIQAMLAHAI